MQMLPFSRRSFGAGELLSAQPAGRLVPTYVPADAALAGISSIEAFANPQVRTIREKINESTPDCWKTWQ
jgi:hypothetical protein